MEILIPVRKLLPVSCRCGVRDSLFYVPISFKHLALVVQRADNSIHRKNHDPVENTYPLDSNLSCR